MKQKLQKCCKSVSAGGTRERNRGKPRSAGDDTPGTDELHRVRPKVPNGGTPVDTQGNIRLN